MLAGDQGRPLEGDTGSLSDSSRASNGSRAECAAQCTKGRQEVTVAGVKQAQEKRGKYSGRQAGAW